MGASEPRSSAIVDETGNLVNDLSRIVAFFVAIDEDKKSKDALATVMGALLLIYSGLQFAEAAISPT
jgi:hypothetical protein